MFKWDDHSEETLKSLWDEGFSASYIAKFMGHSLTRNAVIGKVHRMKLNRKKRYSEMIKNPLLKKVKKGNAPQPVKFINYGVNIMDLTTESCRYIVGKDDKQQHLYCGDRQHKRSYCEHHYNVCHYAPKKVDEKIAHE